MNIPFNKIYYQGKELSYIKDSMERGSISGDGYYSQLVTTFLQEKFSINKILMTTSATHALEMAAILIDIKPGDEVIMPSFTFPSTANAIMLRGGVPVFAEIEQDTLNIDPIDIKRKITDRTKAILPVHYGGVSCDMDKIMKIATKNNLFVIEDAAQAVNSKYKNRFLGTIGHIGCYSFHSTKNYVSGEGGAIAINSNNVDLIKRAEIIRQKGTNRDEFLRGEVDKYSWVDVGSSYVPSDILMAVLYAQVHDLDEIKEKRKAINDYYNKSITEYIGKGIIEKSTYIPSECESNYHLFYLIFKDKKIRDNVICMLRQKEIYATTHFMPLHSSKKGLELGYNIDDFPITEKVSNCLLRLPMYTAMSVEEIKYIVEMLVQILGEI
ncbi:dTDP-4-amino-4,6-dideoxygalactose transaminase [Clostridium sp.]|uniref:dTDP-4-amino-4,6-dideoxygalactose transaminase n=1 Tax=Clostridium sp. TaxID=1506 RepID=UPI001A414E84|nr:dTDP-4-amino-4,6-dideoxygalactose transaminase [Clostridium sp.]MBK5234486.1 dTDP-4-amino-4,6-dideoxygalactose transaminase [Clostridium sp.]